MFGTHLSDYTHTEKERASGIEKDYEPCAQRTTLLIVIPRTRAFRLRIRSTTFFLLHQSAF